MSKQLSITSLLANKTTGKTTPRIPLVVQPAARPKLGRPPKRPLQEGQQAGPQQEEQQAGPQQEEQQPGPQQEGQQAGPQQEQPPLKRARKGQSTGKWRESQQYGLTPTLLALFPWAASVEGEGLEVFCECLVCSDFKKQSVRIQARTSTLRTHAQCKAHQDASHSSDRIAEVAATQQVLRAGNQAIFDKALALANKEKLPQFKTAFHLLSHGRSMLEYEQSYPLHNELHVPNLSSMHWHDNSGWGVCDAINHVLLDYNHQVCRDARFLSASLDEATAIDKKSYMAMHVYTMVDFARLSYFVDLIEVAQAPTSELVLG